MAGEIQISVGVTGWTVYVQIRNPLGLIWNTSGTPQFENYATANIADYDIVLVEQGTASKSYVGDFPSAIDASIFGAPYLITVFRRIGGSPAETDSIIGTGYYDKTPTHVAAAANKIADHVLRRSLTNARASSDGDSVIFRSILGAMSKLVNRVKRDGTVLTVYQEDDVSSAGTQTLVVDATAASVVEVDTN